MEWQTTTTILGRLRENDRSAWDTFVRRFHRPVVAYCRSTGLSDQDAEDVAQETFAAFANAYREGRYDRQRGRLSGWLFGIAHHQVLRERQRAARRAAKEAPQFGGTTFWAELPDDAAAERQWEQQWERSVLEECYHQARREFQPETFRAFELVVQDRTAAEAAKILGVPVKTIYNAKHRVLKRIREIHEQFETVELNNE